jgi:cell division transport system permease protein
MVNQNIERISFVLLGFSLALLIISIALINNTIRLSVYSKRFILRSMQLVGATKGFIQKPFIIRGIVNGVISSVLAIGLLMLVVYLALQEVPELLQVENLAMYIILISSLLLLGILISWFSTYFAVRKFLRMKTGSLYT